MGEESAREMSESWRIENWRRYLGKKIQIFLFEHQQYFDYVFEEHVIIVFFTHFVC
jgi:hypothetical protein